MFLDAGIGVVTLRFIWESRNSGFPCTRVIVNGSLEGPMSKGVSEQATGS